MRELVFLRTKNKSNIAGHLGKVQVPSVITNVLAVLSKASPDLSQGVQAALPKKQ